MLGLLPLFPLHAEPNSKKHIPCSYRTPLFFSPHSTQVVKIPSHFFPHRLHPVPPARFRIGSVGKNVRTACFSFAFRVSGPENQTKRIFLVTIFLFSAFYLSTFSKVITFIKGQGCEKEEFSHRHQHCAGHSAYFCRGRGFRQEQGSEPCGN